MNYHIGRLVPSSLRVGAFVGGTRFAGWGCASACKTNTTQNQPHQISNTQRTENETTDVVIHKHSRKLLMMDILVSETCWAHKKWNTIASDIKLVFHSLICFIIDRVFVLSMNRYHWWQFREGPKDGSNEVNSSDKNQKMAAINLFLSESLCWSFLYLHSVNVQR